MQGQLPSLQCTELKVGAKTPVWAPEAPSGFLAPSTIYMLWKGHISEWLSHLLLQNRLNWKKLGPAQEKGQVKVELNPTLEHCSCRLSSIDAFSESSGPTVALETGLWLFSTHTCSFTGDFYRSTWFVSAEPFMISLSPFCFVFPQVLFVTQYLCWVRTWWWQRIIFPW